MNLKLLVASLFCLIGTIAHAQTNLPEGFALTNKSILCGPGTTIFKTLASKDVNEKPLWVGQDDSKTFLAVFVNQDTGAFTVIQFGEQMACILGLGEKSDLFKLEINKNRKM